MTVEDFEYQFRRLKTQWPNSYGAERQARIWAVFKNLDKHLFEGIVDRAIDTCRGAPLVEDLSKIELAIKEEYDKSRSQYGLPDFNFMDALENARMDNKTTDPNFVLKCLETLDQKFRSKINNEKFEDKCKELELMAQRKKNK